MGEREPSQAYATPGSRFPYSKRGAPVISIDHTHLADGLFFVCRFVLSTKQLVLLSYFNGNIQAP
jgi:hypothetical protein